MDVARLAGPCGPLYEVGEFPEPVSVFPPPPKPVLPPPPKPVFPPPPKSVLLGKGGRAEVEFE